MASELVDQLRAMVALTNEEPRIPALPRQLATEAANRIEALEAALKPIADAMKWEETEGNFGPCFMPDAPAERFRDEVELRIVAWWGQDWELESADTFCTLGDLRRAASALEVK